MEQPKLIAIKGGWAAVGKDWAVFAQTQDEALYRFQRGTECHEEIMSRDERTKTSTTMNPRADQPLSVGHGT